MQAKEKESKFPFIKPRDSKKPQLKIRKKA